MATPPSTVLSATTAAAATATTAAAAAAAVVLSAASAAAPPAAALGLQCLTCRAACLQRPSSTPHCHTGCPAYQVPASPASKDCPSLHKHSSSSSCLLLRFCPQIRHRLASLRHQTTSPSLNHRVMPLPSLLRLLLHPQASPCPASPQTQSTCTPVTVPSTIQLSNQ